MAQCLTSSSQTFSQVICKILLKNNCFEFCNLLPKTESSYIDEAKAVEADEVNDVADKSIEADKAKANETGKAKANEANEANKANEANCSIPMFFSKTFLLSQKVF
jgi:hypothetical protein